MNRLPNIAPFKLFCLLVVAAHALECEAVGQSQHSLVPGRAESPAREATDGDRSTEPWRDVDYGPSLATTLRIGPGNTALKGIVVRGDHGPGGITEGRDFFVFDTDTLRCAAGWRGAGGIDYHGIALDGDPHSHPTVVGDLLFENPDAPGWITASSEHSDDTRPMRPNGKRYGPISRTHGRWIGHYDLGDQVVWSYEVCGVRVLESPATAGDTDTPLFVRHFEVGPRRNGLLLQVAHDHSETTQVIGGRPLDNQVVLFKAPGSRAGHSAGDTTSTRRKPGREEERGEEGDEDEEDEDDFEEEDDDLEGEPLYYEGDTSLCVARKGDFDLTNSDYTIIAEIRTEDGGTILSQAKQEGEYTPNSKSLFVSDGRVHYDIGWVGSVRSTKEVNDDELHIVAATFSQSEGEVRLYVDGEEDARSELRPTGPVNEEHVLRLGFTTPDFPDEVRGFEGVILQLAFYQRMLTPEEIKQFGTGDIADNGLVANWNEFDHEEDVLIDGSGNEHHARFEDVEEFDDGGDEEDDDEEEEEEVRESLRFDGNSVRVELGQLGGDRGGRESYTLAARVRTINGGPMFAVAAKDGSWQPNNVCWFIRDGKLAFDLGHVGQVQGWKNVADGQWHDVAMTYNGNDGQVSFIVDGQQDRVEPVEGENTTLIPIEEESDPTTGWIGYASEEFPEEAPKYFSGQISKLRIYAGDLSADEIGQVMAMAPAESLGVLAAWEPAYALDGVVFDHSDNGIDGVVRRTEEQTAPAVQAFPFTVASVVGAPAGAELRVDDGGQIRLFLPAGNQLARFAVVYSPAYDPDVEGDSLAAIHRGEVTPLELAKMVRESVDHEVETIETTASTCMPGKGPFVVDELALPAENTYGSRLQPTGLDFFDDGHTAAICTLAGEVWTAVGVGHPSSKRLVWRRVASGLCQPLGLKMLDGQIYVTCRDQITVLRDFDGDGVTDFYEAIDNSSQLTEHAGEFAIGLESDGQGNLYYLRATPQHFPPCVPQHGTLMQVHTNGSPSRIVASGFNAPSGLCVNSDSTFFVSDLAGQWTPKNRINLVREGGFYGKENVVGGQKLAANYHAPALWVHGDFDEVPADLVHVESDRWGPLKGYTLAMSHSSGAVNVVLQSQDTNRPQVAVYRLPIPKLPIAAGWGRFNPGDGQLYACGFVDSSNGAALDQGYLYRIRYTSTTVPVPLSTQVSKTGVSITFTGRLDAESASDWRNYSAARWDYRRSMRYGSEDYRVSDPRRRGRDRLLVADVDLSTDRRTVTLRFADMTDSDQMEVKCGIKAETGESLNYEFLLTIQGLQESVNRLSSNGP